MGPQGGPWRQRAVGGVRLSMTRMVDCLSPHTLPYTATWDGRDSSGHAVASGVYFYRLIVRQTNGREGRDFTASRRMVLVK